MDISVKTISYTVLAFLCVFILFSLLRAIRGPRRADRILGINMLGSLSTASIAVLSVGLGESWLLDVCLIYCMISFLAVVVLARIHISEAMEERKEAGNDDN